MIQKILKMHPINCSFVGGTDIKICIYPFMPNGISHRYQLERSISVLRDARLYFPFLFKGGLTSVPTHGFSLSFAY